MSGNKTPETREISIRRQGFYGEPLWRPQAHIGMQLYLCISPLFSTRRVKTDGNTT